MPSARPPRMPSASTNVVFGLLLLGWAYDDKAEFFTRQEMIEKFTLEKVNNAAASFDCKKLWAFQDHYMQQLSVDAKTAMVLPYLEKAKLIVPYPQAAAEDGSAAALPVAAHAEPPKPKEERAAPPPERKKKKKKRPAEVQEEPLQGPLSAED